MEILFYIFQIVFDVLVISYILKNKKERSRNYGNKKNISER